MTEKKLEAKIEFEELDPKAMFLHTHLGDGTLGKAKFDVNLRLPDYSFVIETGNKKFIVKSQSIISSVVDAVNKK